MEEIQKFVENNEYLKLYMKYPKEELNIIRMYINLELAEIQKREEKEEKTEVKLIKTCFNELYNYLDYILSYRHRVDSNYVSIQNDLKTIKELNVCDCCNCNVCIKRSVMILIEEVNKYNQDRTKKISYISVIDYILDRKEPKFKSIPDKKFFKKVKITDLMYIHLILENDLIKIDKYNKKEHTVEFSYMDLTRKGKNEYYINILLDYYKSGKRTTSITLNLEDIQTIYNEKDEFKRIYKIASYYQYLIEVEKIDIVKKLREMLKSENTEKGIRIRVYYFIYKYMKKVEELPYSRKTKEKIYNILNYILNYRFKEGTPFIPINILIYSTDQEGIEQICEIIGEFMWFFCYLPYDMAYYNEYINNIILDKYLINKLYGEENKSKTGILLLHNFENLLYTDYMQRNLILNILTDGMHKNNKKVCTIIYGEREVLNQILGNHHRLLDMLINLELEIDNLDIEKIYELVVNKLERSMTVPENTKSKIYNYIKSTYMQSDLRNIEYVNKLYNLIILNMNSVFSLNRKQELNEKYIPDAYNTRDLSTIMKDINQLVGLEEIKEQINDLVALLKFNKKANIDINNFNLHMVFSGNPGTGKTTVARLIKDIFFNLGYINQNKLIEVTSRDLIAEYLGQTAGKTYSVVKSALGGVLFIDEAYSITMGDYNHGMIYGEECIATLLKIMEDYKDKLIIIFAGYKEEMKAFLKSNPGLVSRIGYKINFPDYTLDELTQIYLDLLEKNKLKTTKGALEKIKKIIKEASEYSDFGNARYINNMFQKILIEHSKNVDKKNKKTNLYQIVEDDINYNKLIVDNKKKKLGF